MASYEYPADQQYGTVIIGGGISATPIDQAAIVITAPNKCEGYAEGGNSVDSVHRIKLFCSRV